MISEPCSFTDFEEGICFDSDDPDFYSQSNENKRNVKIVVEGKRYCLNIY